MKTLVVMLLAFTVFASLAVSSLCLGIMEKHFSLQTSMFVAGRRITLSMLLIYLLFGRLVIPSLEQPAQVLLVMALLSPLLLIGLYLLFRHWGELVLLDDRLERRRGRWRRTVQLTQVYAVREKDFHLPPNFVLQTPSGDFAFSRYVDGFPSLIGLLRRRVAALRPKVSLPFELTVSNSYRLGNGIGLGLLTLTCALGVWYGSIEKGEPGAALFLGGILWVHFVIIWYYTSVQPKIPCRMEFTKQRITAYWPRGRSETYPPNRLREVKIRTQKTWVKIRHGKAVQAVDYPLTMTFSDGRRITLTESRISAFGYSPETLREIICMLYDM